ncbi:MAG: M48 family metallopeptidase [Desulfobacterales bacterium]|nr:M48 family metallopeptidase [Desulfobacterales bacterium]
MNIFGIIILIALLGEYALNLAADILNLKALKDNVPQRFKGIYDPVQYEKSQHYLKTNTKFGWVSATFDLLILIVFWFSKGFYWLDHWVRSHGWEPVVTGIAFIGILICIRSVLAFPFSLYATFVIEERFGFNQTSWRTFILDRIKGVALGIILGIPLLAGILAFFEYAGANAWWYCWIAVTLFMLFVQFIAPTWIMPLFNKFEPLKEGEFRSAILAYAASIQFPVKNVFIMDGSRRSRKSNAFFTGFGRNKRIVLFDTLIKQHQISELVAILAHEMGHYKKKHILIGLCIGFAQTGITLYLLSLFLHLPALFDAFFLPQPSVYAGLIFFGLLYTPLALFLGLIMQMISRRNEYAADRFAVETTHDATALIRALQTLSVHNLSNLSPHPFYVFLNYSHPPVLKRIEMITSHGHGR